MGFYVDWVSVSGASKDEVLGKLDLQDTGEVVTWPRKNGHMWAMTGTGRILVVANRHGSLAPAKLAMLSQSASLVGASAESNDCTISVWGYENGRELWSVACVIDDDVDLRDELLVKGSPPAELRPFQDKSLTVTEDDDGAVCFELANEFAEVMSGWAPESTKDSELRFFAAAAAGKPSHAAGSGKRGNRVWLVALLGLALAAILFQIFRS